MKRYNTVLILTIGLISTLITSLSFSQESQEQAAKPPVEAMQAEPETNQPEELSIYGEVQSINDVSDSIVVQYYDYDSDEERGMEIASDKDTAIEGRAALGDIKQNDWVDVVYSVKGGKNIAKSIKVEEEEIVEEAEPEKAPEKIAE